MSPTFNFNEVDAWEPGSAILPARAQPYTCWIDGCDPGRSSGNYPQIELQLREADGLGEIRDWIVLTEQSLGKARALMDAAGIEPPGDIDTDSDDWARYLSRFIGRRVAIVVRDEQSFKDPSQMVPRVAGYKQAVAASDVPAPAYAASGSGSSPTDDLPF